MEVGRSGWEDFWLHAFILPVKQRAWRTGRGLLTSKVAVQEGSAAWPCPWGACHPGSQGTRTQERTSPPAAVQPAGGLAQVGEES